MARQIKLFAVNTNNHDNLPSTQFSCIGCRYDRWTSPAQPATPALDTLAQLTVADFFYLSETSFYAFYDCYL